MSKIWKITIIIFLVVVLGCLIFFILGHNKARNDRENDYIQCVKYCEQNKEEIKEADTFGLLRNCSDWCETTALYTCDNTWPFEVWPYSKGNKIKDFFCEVLFFL